MSLLPNWKRNAQLFNSLVKTSSTIGLYVRDVGGLAVVRVGDAEVKVLYATRYRPRPGEGVVLTFVGNTCRLTGPTAAHDSTGTITAVNAAAGVVTVACDSRTYQLPYTLTYQNASNGAGLGPQVGDLVAINWDGVAYVADKLTSTPVTPTLPPLSSSQKPFTLTFYATQSGSYDTVKNRWSSSDLYCDSSHQAAWFYGLKVRHTLNDSAWIDSVEVYLPLKSRSGAEPQIGRHSDSSEQSTGVSASDAAVRGWKGWIDLPTSWADGWRTDPAGVTISGGNSVYDGIAADRQSGKLRIRGRQ